MVTTIVLFDAPHAPARQILESVLREHGYVWLFPNARWSASRTPAKERLARRLRSRLTKHAYRVMIVEMRGRMAPDVRWVTSSSAGRR